VGTIRLDADFLAEFGTFDVPRNLWDAMTHYACWIEPAILNEWCALMAQYDAMVGKPRTLDEYQRALTWLDEEHDTRVVREIVAALRSADRPVWCVWTGKRLGDAYAVDHCFPFARWPNNDLWNLMPASPSANTSKSDRLPSALCLESARGRILDWWHDGYGNPGYLDRFRAEVTASLPITRIAGTADPFDRAFAGLQHQRIRLRTDQQLAEWEGGASPGPVPRPS